MNANLTFDTRDDRRELHILLGKLPPARRIDFLNWCCGQAKLGRHEAKIKVSTKCCAVADLARRDDSADRKLTLDLFFDLWVLATHYSFDLGIALARLEQIVRKI